MMNILDKSGEKTADEPNHAALQHAGLAIILMMVVLFSFFEMARAAISHPTMLPDIVEIR